MRRVLLTVMGLIVPVGAALAGAQALRYWLKPQADALELRVPTDLKHEWPPGHGADTGKPVNPGTLVRGDGTPSTDVGLWPWFRGPDHTNVAPPREKLLREWPASGPERLWSLPVGEGYAGAAVRNGRVYLIDYDTEKKEDAVRCLSLADGKEIWRYTYSVLIRRYHGMSRTVPAVTDDFVVTFGPKGHVVCLKAKTGEVVWKMDLVKDYGTEIPEWYAGQCPLIDGDRVILAPSANPLMMAVQLATGEVVWKTANPGGWKMTHTSVMPMDYRGERQYVYCTMEGVAGVRASDGKLLWKTTEWVHKIAVASPLVVPPDRIFFSVGYGGGAAMFRLTGEGESIRVERLFALKEDVFGSAQHTPILYDGHIYGVVPDGQLVCLDLEGKVVWRSGGGNTFYLAPYLMADGMLLMMKSHQKKGRDDTLHLVEAGTGGYRELASAKVFDKGTEAWGMMALASGKLILRDYDRMICVRVGRREE